MAANTYIYNPMVDNLSSKLKSFRDNGISLEDVIQKGIVDPNHTGAALGYDRVNDSFFVCTGTQHTMLAGIKTGEDQKKTKPFQVLN